MFTTVQKYSAVLSLTLAVAAVPLFGMTTDVPLSPRTAASTETIVLSGGCFWGMQWVFEHVKGVTAVTAGYTGGSANTAEYETVSSGTTGHAESVKITFDPTQVSLNDILRVFFTVAHDPTELNRQGPDEGTQYRSAVWFTTDEQKKAIDAYITQLRASKKFSAPIVTTVAPLHGFYAAEGYHQDYAEHHPDALYIVYNDRPKMDRLRTQCPDLYRAESTEPAKSQP